MGAGNSKPSSGTSQHVFEATGARTSFSSELVSALQDSSTSDSTRNSALELRIQSRVTDELQRLADGESSRLQSLIESATSDKPQEPAQDTETSITNDDENSDPSLLSRLTGSNNTNDKQANLSNSTVSKEIAELKKKLEGRRKVEEPDRSVLQAKDELIACLRINDRRPLDCWKEKEAFKREVGRLEREFVSKTVR